MKSIKRLWKFYCQEDKFPGMWQRWLKNQCVGVGWADEWRYYLDDSPKRSRRDSGWIPARNCLNKIQIGDYVIVSLHGNRVGRLGEVTKLAIKEWNPLVPKSRNMRDGEIGRRILVRWEPLTGPDDRDLIVKLPENARFNPGEVRPTVVEISITKLDRLIQAMNDPRNWESLFEFPYEQSLSDYIATFPHRLEDGLLPHPNIKVRELRFANRKRADVMLTDKNDRPVIVECKQGEPTVANVKQLADYLRQFKKKEGETARGILVHGGSRKLRVEVRKVAREIKIEIVQFTVEVNFSSSN